MGCVENRLCQSMVALFFPRLQHVRGKFLKSSRHACAVLPNVSSRPHLDRHLTLSLDPAPMIEWDTFSKPPQNNPIDKFIKISYVSIKNHGGHKMLVGLARTSTLEQEAGLEAQVRDLKAFGCDEIYQEQVGEPNGTLLSFMKVVMSGLRII